MVAGQNSLPTASVTPMISISTVRVISSRTTAMWKVIIFCRGILQRAFIISHRAAITVGALKAIDAVGLGYLTTWIRSILWKISIEGLRPGWLVTIISSSRPIIVAASLCSTGPLAELISCL